MANYDAGASGFDLGAGGVEAPDEQKFDVFGSGLALGAEGVEAPDELRHDAGGSSFDVITSFGVGFWTPFPYEGDRWLKVLNTGTPNPYAEQTTLVPGTEYRLVVYGLSDGYALPRVIHDGAPLWTGEALTVWQLCDVTFTATSTEIQFVGANSSTGQWVGFDFASCETTLPLVDVACFTAEVIEPLPLGFNVEELGRILQETTLGGVKSYLIVKPVGAFAFDTPSRGFDLGKYGGTF